jgi:hypothetical protein
LWTSSIFISDPSKLRKRNKKDQIIVNKTAPIAVDSSVVIKDEIKLISKNENEIIQRLESIGRKKYRSILIKNGNFNNDNLLDYFVSTEHMILADFYVL